MPNLLTCHQKRELKVKRSGGVGLEDQQSASSSINTIILYCTKYEKKKICKNPLGIKAADIQFWSPAAVKYSASSKK